MQKSNDKKDRSILNSIAGFSFDLRVEEGCMADCFCNLHKGHIQGDTELTCKFSFPDSQPPKSTTYSMARVIIVYIYRAHYLLWLYELSSVVSVEQSRWRLLKNMNVCHM